MGTSGARPTSSALDYDPTTTITDAAPARFLRLLRFLRLDLPHWGANQSVQRTGASLHAEWRCGRARRLAPVADLGVRLPKPSQTASMSHPSHPCAGAGPQREVPQAWFCRKERKKAKEVIQSGMRCVGRGRVCCRPFRPLSFLSATRSHWGSEPVGPANGSQPARRVVMRALAPFADLGVRLRKGSRNECSHQK